MNATPKWVIFALMALGVSSIVGWIEVLDQHRQVDQLRQSADKRTLALDKIIGKWADIQNVDQTLTIAESRDQLIKDLSATDGDLHRLAERVKKLEAVKPSGGNVGEIEGRMRDRFAAVSKRIDELENQMNSKGCGCVLVPIGPEPAKCSGCPGCPDCSPKAFKTKPAPKKPKRCP